MTDKEVRDCIQLLKVLNPELATGFPKGARIPFKSLPNTRDLGALIAKDGRHILPHRLLRSGCLYHISLQDEDTLLDEYHLSTVVDFRTRMEILQKPDSILEGVEYHEIPIVDEETLGITRSKGLLEMLLGFNQPIDEFMQKQYISFVRDDFSVKEYARFLDVLLHPGRWGRTVALQHGKRQSGCRNCTSSLCTGNSERNDHGRLSSDKPLSGG